MTSKTRIYLIEDRREVFRFVQNALADRDDMELVGYSDNYSHADLIAAQAKADVYLVDLGLPDGSGEDLLRKLSRECPSTELLVFTVFGDESRLIRALQMGATGYVLKGCTSEELIEAIDDIRKGGAPISPLLARTLLKQFREPESEPALAEISPAAANASLSERETTVLKLIAQGYVNREIAERLGVSSETVNTHVKRMYRKLSINSRVQAVHAAKVRGLL